MKFKTDTQKACYDRVARWMKELFGELAVVGEESPVFFVNMGSAVVHVVVFAWNDDDATITARAYLVRGAELTVDLLKYLLRENADMRFGAFGIDDDGDILFEHTIRGSTCEKEELKASVMAVLAVADKYDDEIVARWGGLRALD
jgi:hypothetical protein